MREVTGARVHGYGKGKETTIPLSRFAILLQDEMIGILIGAPQTMQEEGHFWISLIIKVSICLTNNFLVKHTR